MGNNKEHLAWLKSILWDRCLFKKMVSDADKETKAKLYNTKFQTFNKENYAPSIGTLHMVAMLMKSSLKDKRTVQSIIMSLIS